MSNVLSSLGGARESIRSTWPLLGPVILVAVIAFGASWTSAASQRTATNMFINLILVVGLYIFAGNSGILSFGHMSFAAVGAYVGAITTIEPTQRQFLLPGLPAVLSDVYLGRTTAALVAGMAAVLLALVLSIPLMRVGGMAAALGMFAVLLIVNVIAGNLDAITRGQEGLFGLSTTTSVANSAAWAAIAILAAFLFQQSRLGLRLRAVREDEIAARSLGIGIFTERTAAFVLSAFVVGVGGFLTAEFLSAFGPSAFYLQLTFLTIAMLVIGGTTSLAGAVTGTVVVSGLLEGFRRVESGFTVGPLSIGSTPGLREIGLGVVMILVLWWRPSGITGGREIYWPWRARRFAPRFASSTVYDHK